MPTATFKSDLRGQVIGIPLTNLKPGGMVLSVPKSRSTPSRSFELTLSDVFLLTVDEDGEVALSGLGVVVDHLGLTVTKADGSVAAVLKWGQLQTLRAGERIETPSGTPTVVIEAVSTSRTHRFAVPTDDPDGLELVVAELASSAAADIQTRGRREKKRGWRKRR